MTDPRRPGAGRWGHFKATPGPGTPTLGHNRFTRCNTHPMGGNLRWSRGGLSARPALSAGPSGWAERRLPTLSPSPLASDPAGPDSVKPGRQRSMAPTTPVFPRWQRRAHWRPDGQDLARSGGPQLAPMLSHPSSGSRSWIGTGPSRARGLELRPLRAPVTDKHDAGHAALPRATMRIVRWAMPSTFRQLAQHPVRAVS